MTATYRYAVVPAPAIVDSSVDATALRVLCLLARHVDGHGWCYRAQTKMAAELGVSRPTVIRAIAVLIDAGYVEKRPRGRAGQRPPQEGDHPYTAYYYRVRLDTGQASPLDTTHAPPADAKAAAPPVKQIDTPCPSNGHPLSAKRTPERRLPSESHPSEDSPPGPPRKRDFSVILGGKDGERQPRPPTIANPQERVHRFAVRIAEELARTTGIAAAWLLVAAAQDATAPEHAAALAKCKTAARSLGKGWPRAWPIVNGGAA